MWKIGTTNRTDGRIEWAERRGANKQLPFFRALWCGPWAIAIMRYEAAPGEVVIEHAGHGLEFDDWIRQLGKVSEGLGIKLGEIDREAWRDYYDDGYSPRDALYEDATYA